MKGKMFEEVLRKLKGIEFNSFSIGVSSENEEEKEKIKKELKEEIINAFKVKYDFKNPEVVVLVNLKENKIDLKIKPLFIYGKYNKYAKIPQTKWPCRECKGKGCERCNFKGKLYEETVEDLIAKPLLELTKGKETKFHGAGREDIDVLCYGWREFIIEIKEPKIRNLKLKEVEKKINEFAFGKVEVKDLRFANKKEVREIKEKRSGKIYEVLVGIKNIEKVKEKFDEVENRFKNIVIKQKTPKRVMHRRALLIRKRKIKWVKVKKIEKNEVVLEISAEAGTYIKEFVTGDEGRTSPSLKEFLGVELKVKEMKVIGFE